MCEHPYRILVTTSNHYLPILRVSSWLVNKYWLPTPQVLVAGFNKPNFSLPDNYEFVSLGDQNDYPFSRWSAALIKLLNIIDDEVFVLFLDDYLPVRFVDTRNVQILVDYAHQFGYVLKIDICCDRLYAFGVDTNYSTVAHIDLIKSQPGSPYHSSLYPGIWRKDNMLRTLLPEESPHDYELTGTTRISHMQDLLVLGTRNYPLRITLGLRGGESGKLNLSELAPQDQQELRDLGYLKPWEDNK